MQVNMVIRRFKIDESKLKMLEMHLKDFDVPKDVKKMRK